MAAHGEPIEQTFGKSGYRLKYLEVNDKTGASLYLIEHHTFSMNTIIAMSKEDIKQYIADLSKLIDPTSQQEAVTDAPDSN